jgi:hypothetical protein
MIITFVSIGFRSFFLGRASFLTLATEPPNRRPFFGRVVFPGEDVFPGKDAFPGEETPPFLFGRDQYWSGCTSRRFGQEGKQGRCGRLEVRVFCTVGVLMKENGK